MPSERDDLAVQVLERIERPVEPDPEFASALLERLLAELPETPAPETGRRGLLVLRRRLVAAVAAAAVVIVGIGVVLTLRPVEESALAAVRDAQQRASTVPPFRAIVSRRVGGELALGTVAQAMGRDWVSVAELSYGNPTQWRRALVRDSLAAAARRVVWDGRTLGIDRPEQRRFYVLSAASPRGQAAASQLSPLATLSPRFRVFPLPAGADPEAYIVDRCRVAGADSVAGRPARVLACGDDDFRFTLWLDVETGLLLRLETPGDVLEVRRIDYGVSFGRDAFRTEPPAGATVVRIGGTP